MPEYLAPGVYVEETSFRSRSIEGVATSTTGIAGLAAWGPVRYGDADITGPASNAPRLITSFTEFQRVYGGLEELHIGTAAPGAARLPYMAHAARAFFENGGRRLYVSRVFVPRAGVGAAAFGVAQAAVPVSAASAFFTARWPGALGNMFVKVSLTRSKNIAFARVSDALIQARGVRAGAVVEVIAAPGPAPSGNAPATLSTLRVVAVDAEGTQTFIDETGAAPPLAATDIVQSVQLAVQVTVGTERVEEFREIATSPAQRRDIRRILEADDPEDEDCPVSFSIDTSGLAEPEAFHPALLAQALRGTEAADAPYGLRLAGGHDGALLSPDALGGEAADPDDPLVTATGLEALAEIDDIAICLAPDTGNMGDPVASRVAAQALVTHAERASYRIAIIDGPVGSSLNEIRDFRGQFDSTYAALYYPWIRIFDPNERFSQGTPPRQLLLPPSGFVAGIYARNDVERGVHKAPANEVIRGLTRFEININRPRQEVINPEGINALRFFDGRGFRVWGARTITSDSEWKYVNVRRLFIFIEHSIDLATQWAVFEPNNRRLWDNIRRMVEDFLLVQWRDGALLGAKPEDAFFVRCDRTTMTQNDLDNGRLICLVGMAPVKPAEFVIFRVGQWTADAQT